MRKTPLLKYLRFLHQFLKSGKYKKYEQRYHNESDKYQSNYSYYQPNNDNPYHRSKVHDYQQGVDNYHYDVEYGCQIKFFPVKLMKLVNPITGNRLNEIIDYMRGYQDAKNNHHS